MNNHIYEDKYGRGRNIRKNTYTQRNLYKATNTLGEHTYGKNIYIKRHILKRIYI